jgi:hypothetical protein
MLLCVCEDVGVPPLPHGHSRERERLHWLRCRDRPRPQPPIPFACWPHVCRRRNLDLRRVLTSFRDCVWTSVFESCQSGRRIAGHWWTNLRGVPAVRNWQDCGSVFLPLAYSFPQNLSASIGKSRAACLRRGDLSLRRSRNVVKAKADTERI